VHALATPAAPGLVSVCVECGKPFPPEEMIRYSGATVCGACKPVFFQKLKQGVHAGTAFHYAGFWIRFCAKFIDNFIMWVVNMLLMMVVLLVSSTQNSQEQALALNLLLNFVGIILQASYSTFFIGKFGATRGKMAMRLRVIRPDGEKVTYLRALGRHFAEMLSAIILGIGYSMVAFDDEKRALHDRICDTRVIRV